MGPGDLGVKVGHFRPVDLLETGGAAPLPRARLGYTTSSCGLCGRESVEQLCAWLAPLTETEPIALRVLAAVPDEDLGEGSAVNDAAARIGAVVAIALVPALVGAGSCRTWAAALDRGFGPAMITIGVVCGLAALVAGLFVSSGRPTASHRFVPPAPDHGCAVPCRVEPAVTR